MTPYPFDPLLIAFVVVGFMSIVMHFIILLLDHDPDRQLIMHQAIALACAITFPLIVWIASNAQYPHG